MTRRRTRKCRAAAAGVDVGWIQSDRLVTLSFSTIGPDAPKATERTQQVVELARRVAERL